MLKTKIDKAKRETNFYFFSIEFAYLIDFVCIKWKERETRFIEKVWIFFISLYTCKKHLKGNKSCAHKSGSVVIKDVDHIEPLGLLVMFICQGIMLISICFTTLTTT